MNKSSIRDEQLEKELEKAIKENELKKNVFQILKAEESAKNVKEKRLKGLKF